MDSDPQVIRAANLDPKFEVLVVGALKHHDSFIAKFSGLIDPDSFIGYENRCIVDLLLKYYEKYDKSPSDEVFERLLTKSGYRDRDKVQARHRSLPIPDDLRYIEDQVLDWIRWRRIEDVLSDPGARDDIDAFVREVDVASRTGADVNAEYVSILDDEAARVTRPTIQTPWPWLNRRFGVSADAGPEYQDFLIAMTVINGGKSTILTNIARHAAGCGKNVVYFTFEDGEFKMRRRMLQSIAGISKEDLVSNLEDARDYARDFLDQNNGGLFIKRLRSRQSTVRDAVNLIKMIEDAEGRGVDLVITDYPDRFKSMRRWDEPRHELREIYEDCKSLAMDHNLVHWGASQINKTKTGKDVVGIEDGSESTGKFESCDVAVGFGQTIADNRAGRITIATSKMRDAAKNETASLIADFDMQRIYEPGHEPPRMEKQKKFLGSLKKKSKLTKKLTKRPQ